MRWPGGEGWFSFSGDKTTYLDRAVPASGATFERHPLGAGEILFLSLPLELSDDVELLSRVYRWALDEAGVEPVYRTGIDDPGIVIIPTALEEATLYVVASESSEARRVSWKPR